MKPTLHKEGEEKRLIKRETKSKKQMDLRKLTLLKETLKAWKAANGCSEADKLN